MDGEIWIETLVHKLSCVTIRHFPRLRLTYAVEYLSITALAYDRCPSPVPHHTGWHRRYEKYNGAESVYLRFGSKHARLSVV
jgi:hypothetical protein